MIKKLMWLLSLIALLSFTSCGGGSSKEARELLQKILQFVGIPHNIVANICQDANRDGICGGGELFTKVTINKGDSIDDIWEKISLTEDGKYFLETYTPKLPILVELQDVAKVNYDDGKFTLALNGFKTKEDDNETKEVSILESMVDTNTLTKTVADKFRTLSNTEAQDKYYTALFDSLETNINTLRTNELDRATAMSATIKEMADETKANQEQADRINGCENNQTCVDEEIKKISDELSIDENETKEIVSTQNGTAEPILTQSTPQTSTSKLKKTGQTTSYEAFDDGYYQRGITQSYSRNKEIVIDNVTKLQWQDNEDAKTNFMNWEEAKNYCSSLLLGDYKDWRLPTRIELLGIVDYGHYNPAINPIFLNTGTSNNGYVSSTTFLGDTTKVWVIGFYSGGEGATYHDKFAQNGVRCVRGTINTIDDSYSRKNDVVVDKITKLEWQDNEQVYLNLSDAIDYCNKLSLDGGNWRLPNINELATLVDDTRFNPEINPIFKFGRGWFKSSTTTAMDSEKTWVLTISYSDTLISSSTIASNYPKLDTDYIKCVRGGD